ncbi:Trimeric GatFAB AmidoTransferase(AdT) complex subunit [Coemansia sp. RSA 552]|nr:Trimeric GatFAB AmidoTransferase(AdT) complex subunit [Coemansia sp. RSA 552]
MRRLLRQHAVRGAQIHRRGLGTASADRALEEIARLNSRLNAFVCLREPAEIAEAMEEARGKGGELEGWTLAVKSNIATPWGTTSCGSRELRDYQSPMAATVVETLERAGAVAVGKTNMDEFGMGSMNQYSVHGPAHNPRRPQHKPEEAAADHSPGGSSGGSAAAVAANMCRVALGSDTGGSVRLPAAWCGVVGFKPTYGRISRYGLTAYGSSLDAIGIIARNTKDTRAAYAAAALPDARDMTCMSRQLRKRIAKLAGSRPWINGGQEGGSRPLEGIRIGIPREFWVDELSEPAVNSWMKGAERLALAGCEVVPVSLPLIPHTLPAYYTLALAEASSNLARYDGVRFGARSYPYTPAAGEEKLVNASLRYADTRSQGLGDEVQRRILLGTYVMSESACRDFYLPSQRIRRELQNQFNAVFAMPHALGTSAESVGGRPAQGIDAILTPTSTDTAPVQGEEGRQSPVTAYVNDVMTVPANLAGLPAISVPGGHKDGMPLGLQLVGQYGDDELVLRIAGHLQS